MHEKLRLADTGLLSKLVSDYLNEDPKLAFAYQDYPRIESFSNTIQNKQFPREKREILHEVLIDQYRGLNNIEIATEQIDLLLKKDTYTVTTGHQLCLATGPLYSIYKIATCIKLSRELKAFYPEQNFIPVFWMASEDHDKAEIDHFHLFKTKWHWNTDQKGAVGRFRTEGIDFLWTKLEQKLENSPETNGLLELLKSAYSRENLSQAMQQLVHGLFGNEGLVILDADNPKLKNSCSDLFSKELKSETSFREIQDTNAKLEKLNYHIQVHGRECNLFYMDDQVRDRIVKEGDDFFRLDGHERHPIDPFSDLSKISPNAILRPVYQEAILPNLAYIGGGGEIAYWLQLKDVFKAFDIEFPTLIVRNSFLLFSKKEHELLKKLEFEYPNLLESTDDLIKKYLSKIDESENYEFIEEVDSLKNLFAGIKSKLKAIDPVLENATEAELTKQIKGLENLKKKAQRSLKQKEEIKLNKIRKLKEAAFPEGVLQERYANLIFLWMILGEDCIQKIIDLSEPLNPALHFINN